MDLAGHGEGMETELKGNGEGSGRGRGGGGRRRGVGIGRVGLCHAQLRSGTQPLGDVGGHGVS